jgi:hypothetical protein
MVGVASGGVEHSIHSTLRERIVEHMFVGEALRWLWVHRKADLASVEVLRSEFDAGGYDLVMTCGQTVRYIQLKTTLVGGKAASIKVCLKLMNRPKGCIIWVFITPKLEIKEYRWFESKQFLEIKARPAKHTKGNAQGKKAEKPQQRTISRGAFDEPCKLPDLMEKLFGQRQ